MSEWEPSDNGGGAIKNLTVDGDTGNGEEGRRRNGVRCCSLSMTERSTGDVYVLLPSFSLSGSWQAVVLARGNPAGEFSVFPKNFAACY